VRRPENLLHLHHVERGGRNPRPGPQDTKAPNSHRPRESRSASGFLFNEFRFDRTAFSDEAGAAALDALSSGNLNNENHRRDALAAETARTNSGALLTNEKRRLRNGATELGIEVHTTDELFAEIGFAPATS
jgi:uncharacterized protein involved in type VI secretion and phage assembly